MGIKGMSNLRSDLNNMVHDIEDAGRETEEEIAEQLADAIAADAPVDTGYLRSSVHAIGNEVEIGADYAEFVERDEHFIQQNIDAMRSEGAKIAEVVIRKAVS